MSHQQHNDRASTPIDPSHADGAHPHDTAEAVARRSYAKLVAFLASRTRDVAAAEDALSEAFASALVDWPRNGCPANPEAWLLTVARRKAIDVMRAHQRHEFGNQQWMILAEMETTVASAEIPDQRLALLFACAHPAIDAAVRPALMLQTVLGLGASRIASAFLTSPSAMSKRLVRAKEKIRAAGIPFCVPEREELADRVGAVLDAIYAAFTEGWDDANGTDLARRDLADEAMFLAKLLIELLPEEPEALGLLALMLHAEARRLARRNKNGDYVPLAQQDHRLWDMQMISQAEALLRRASSAASVGRYQLEAAVQSAHVYRRRTGQNNWEDIVRLYRALLELTSSPVVAINRALAIAETQGADAGLRALPEAKVDARLADYQPFWAARAELLARTGASEEARQAYEMAIGLEHDAAVRRFLQARLAALAE